MSAKFCSNCGNPLHEGGKFCGRCGTPVSAPAQKPVIAPVAAPVVAPVVAPVQEPVAAPVQEPVAAPVQEPVAAPVQEPVAAPVQEPVAIPVAALVQEPVVSPVVAPAQEPAAAPAAAPMQEPAVRQNSLAQEPAPWQVEVPEPVATPVKPATRGPKAKKKSKLPHRNGGMAVLAVLLCVLLFFTAFTSLTVVNVWTAISKCGRSNTFETLLENVDLEEFPASELVIGLRDDDEPLVEWLMDELKNTYNIKLRFDADELVEYYNESALVPFLADSAAAYVDAFFEGKDGPVISASAIEDFLEQDEEMLEEAFSVKVTDDSIETTAKLAAAFCEDYLEVPSADSAAGSVLPVVPYLVGLVLAAVLVLLVVIIGGLTVLICLVNRSALRSCNDLGITFMVAGGIWGVAGLVSMLLPGVVYSLFSGALMIGIGAMTLLEVGLIAAAALFGIGLVLLLVSIFGKMKAVKAE